MKQAPPQTLQPPYTSAATHTFIIRIWHDRSGKTPSQPIWRGVVEQVGSDRHVYFFDFDSLGRFIQEQTGLPIKEGSHLLRRKGSHLISAIFKWIRHAE